MHKLWRAITTPQLSWLSFVFAVFLSGLASAAWRDYREPPHSGVLITCATLGGTDCTHEVTIEATGK